MSETISAHCSCGAVQFTAQGQPLTQLVCHCRDCQKVTNLPFAGLVFFKSSRVTISSSGDLSYQHFIADSGKKTSRTFCGKCDSLMFDQSEGFPGIIGVLQERILGDFEFLPQCHVWVKSKRDDIIIPDGATQFSENIIL